MDTRPGFQITDHDNAEPLLYPWDRGAAVADLQELLNAHGFYLRIDGDFNGITEAAVRAYQRQQGLLCNGIVDRQTWRSLKSTVQAGTRALQEGDSGADVYELQGLLQIHGYRISRNSRFDAETKEAVLAFQKRHRLHADGIVGSITWTMLRGEVPLPPPPKQPTWFVNARKWW